MRIEAHNSLTDPINAEVTSVVVYDDHGQPIGLFVSQGSDSILVSTVKDGQKFYQNLKNFGISNTRVVVTRETNTSDNPTFEPWN